jgi:alanyl-tRNA synthetase
MLTRISVATGLAAILLSTAALADSATTATTTPATKPLKTESAQKLADRCAALETQFDQAITGHGTAAKAATAKQLRTTGATLCSSNKQANGIKKLQQALKDLGVKPNA